MDEQSVFQRLDGVVSVTSHGTMPQDCSRHPATLMEVSELKVLLINPPQFVMKDFDLSVILRGGEGAYPPLGLGYVASAVAKSGHDVTLYDNFFDGIIKLRDSGGGDVSIFMSSLDEYIENSPKPDVVCLSMMFSAFYNGMLECLKRTRRSWPDTVTVVGGSHATMAPESLYSVDQIDYIVTYEGEETLPKLLNCLENGGNVSEIPGLHYRVNGTFEGNIDFERIADLDSLEWPDWHALNIADYYRIGRFGGAHAVPNASGKPCAPILTSRGCRGRCAFCSAPKLMGHKVRMRSPNEVVDELEYLIKEFGIRFFDITDDDFTYSKQRSIDICKEIVRRRLDIQWSAKNGLIACSLDRDVIGAMSDSGCRYVAIGIESANEDILRWLRKPISIPKLKEVRQIFREFPEIYLAGYFIIGFPDETREMMYETRDLALELELDWNAVTMAQPLPGSRMYEDLVDADVIREDNFDFSDLMFFHNTMGNEYCTADEIFDLWHEINYRINFVQNPNLNGGRIDRAICDFDYVGHEVAPGHAIALYHLGKAWEKKGCAEEAARAFVETRKAIDDSPDWQRWFDFFELVMN